MQLISMSTPQKSNSSSSRRKKKINAKESDMPDEDAAGGKKPASTKPSKKQKKQPDSEQVCTRCHQKGHLRPWNKKCKYFAEYTKRKEEEASDKVTLPEPTATDDDATSTAGNESVAMAEELAQLETLPLEDVDSEGSLAYFSACSDYS